MKQIRLFLMCVLMTSSIFMYAQSASPKRELRATWVTTAWNSDWPSSRDLSAEEQKAELRNIIDKLYAANFNALFLQVRSFSDAFYKSSYEPWSYYLTGTRGKDPGYDPLQYAIDYAHSKGIELHAWVNPYRYSSSQYNYGEGANDYATTHPEWIMHSKNDEYITILNPGIPAVRQLIADVVAEIVTNYDIDGVVFDDYFYLNSGDKHGGTKDEEDAAYYEQYNPQGLSLADWRRDQVNQMVAMVHDTIKNIKPYVRFGIAPAGVAGTIQAVADKYGVDKCPVGSDWQYNGIYSDPLAWLKAGTIDYISPQLYWAIGSSADYDALSKWWSIVANKFCRHLYVSHTLSNLASWGDSEYASQVVLNRQYDKNGAPGSVFFSTKSAMNSATFFDYIKENAFPAPAFLPAMSWQTVESLAAPTNLQLNSSTLSWRHAKADRFTVYAFNQGEESSEAFADAKNLVGVVYGTSIDLNSISDYSTKTLAVCAYDRYGNEHPAAFYNVAVPTPILTASVESVNLMGIQGSATKKYQDVTIAGSLLSSDITINAMGTGFTYECLSDWNAHTGGTLRVVLDNSAEAKTHTGEIVLSSGDNQVKIQVSATITTSSSETPDPTQPVEGTLSLTEGWRVLSTTENTYIGTSNDNRSVAYYDGKLYVPNYNTKQFYIINAETGELIATKDLGVTSGVYAFNLCMTEDGQLLSGNSVGSPNDSVRVFAVDAANGGLSAETQKYYSGARTDFFAPYGKWGESGYIVSLNNEGTATYVPFSQGELNTAAAKMISTNITSGLISPRAIPCDANSFYVNARGLPRKYSITGDLLETFAADISIGYVSSGMATFTLGGKPYMILPTSDQGAFKIFDISKGIDEAMNVSNASGISLDNKTNSTYTVDFATYVSGYDAYIYVLAPNNGLAMYKFTLTPKLPAIGASVESLTFSAEEDDYEPSWTIDVTAENLTEDIKVEYDESILTVSYPTWDLRTGGRLVIYAKTDKVGITNSTITITANGQLIEIPVKVTITPQPKLNASEMSIHLTAEQGSTERIYQDVVITGENLKNDIEVTLNSDAAKVEYADGWDQRSGGTLRIIANTNLEIADYSGSIEVSSGDKRAIIDVYVTIKKPEYVHSMNTLWTKKVGEVAYVAAGNVNRSISYYDGALYIGENGTGKLYSINPADGTQKSVIPTNLTTDYSPWNIRVTNDGQFLAGNTDAGTGGPLAINIYTLNHTTGATALLSGDYTIAGRSDYFYTYGDWNGEGYLLALANAGQSFTKIPFANGKLGTPIVVDNLSLPANTSAKAIPALDGKSFYASVRGGVPSQYDFKGNVIDAFGEEKPSPEQTETSVYKTTSGMAVFAVHDHTFMIVALHTLGKFEVYDITEGMYQAKRLYTIDPAFTMKNDAMTIDFAVNVVGDNAYIYMLVPSNGVVAYKFTYGLKNGGTTTELEESIESLIRILPTMSGVEIFFEGKQPVAIYNVNGMQVASGISTEYYTCDLQAGAYIIRVGESVYKFIK